MKWITPLIIITTIILLVAGFLLWMSNLFWHNAFFYLTLVPTVLISAFTLYFLINLSMGYFTRIKKVKTLLMNILMTLLLAIISYTYLIAAIHLRPAQKIVCDFDIEEFKIELKNKYQADSIIIFSDVSQLEPYFDQVRCPYIIIENGITDILDFKTINCDSYPEFENYKQIRECLYEEGRAIADKIYKNCDMSGFDKVVIQFSTFDYNQNKICLDFTFGYRKDYINEKLIDQDEEIEIEMEEY